MQHVDRRHGATLKHGSLVLCSVSVLSEFVFKSTPRITQQRGESCRCAVEQKSPKRGPAGNLRDTGTIRVVRVHLWLVLRDARDCRMALFDSRVSAPIAALRSGHSCRSVRLSVCPPDRLPVTCTEEYLAFLPISAASIQVPVLIITGASIMGTAIRQPENATLPKVAAGFKPSIPIRARYDNWIAGEYVPPARGQYFVNPTPITASRCARSPAPPTRT